MFWSKTRRRKRLAQQQFPGSWLSILEHNVGYYGLLPEQDKEELRRHVLIFISEKRFEGCGGLEMTDEIRVSIAAQACILLLHRRTDYYPGLHSVLVYPRPYMVRQARYFAGGVTIEGLYVRSGESWHRGSIVLSWDDVQKGAADIHDARNIVLHEFAHQLDSSRGRGDNSEVLSSRSKYIAWARVLQKGYERLRRRVRQNRRTLLDRYGATNPAEFFAVATEYFFESPWQLRETHPQLYEQLRQFYHQDPAGLCQDNR